MMVLLFHEQISGAFEPFADEIDLARIALSCHFALELLCFKGHDASSGTIARGMYLLWYGTIATTVTSRY